MIHSIWHSFFLRNPLESYEEAIKVPLTDTSFEEDILIMVLNRLGFRKTTYSNYSIFLPCPLGTFSNYTLLTLEPSVEICIDCPPGMLYLIPENIIETAGIPKKGFFINSAVWAMMIGNFPLGLTPFKESLNAIFKTLTPAQM